MPDETVPDGTPSSEASNTLPVNTATVVSYAALTVYDLTEQQAADIKDGKSQWIRVKDNLPSKTVLIPVNDLPNDHISG